MARKPIRLRDGSIYQLNGKIIPIEQDGLRLFLPLHIPTLKSGSTIWDNSRWRNDGSITGALLDPARKGMWFDGIDDYVNVGAGVSLSLTTYVTLETWVIPDDVTNVRTIVAKRPQSYYANYALRFNSDEVDFYFADGSTWYVIGTSGSGVVAGNPYHIVVTYEYGTTNIDIYINGVFQALGAWSDDPTGVSPTTIGDTTIGRHMESTQALFNGIISEVRIYNCILSPVEISHHYYLTKEFFS